jgi:hypothetical protein
MLGGQLFVMIAILMSSPGLSFATETMMDPAISAKPWWFWPLVLFFFCLILGVLAVMAGVGGGVLYVPLVSGFFPFHIDFVRGIGLMVALAGALAAGPGLLKRNLANLRLALPVALIASTCSIAGAMLGLYLSSLNPDIIQACLGGHNYWYRLSASVFKKYRKACCDQTRCDWNGSGNSGRLLG